MSEERNQVICPWCGWEMVAREGQDIFHGKYNAYVCDRCEAVSPIAYSEDAAYAAATATPPNRPLTLKEAHDYGLLHPDEPIYIEYSMPLEDNSEYACASMMRSFKPDGQGSATYGTSWRCWLRKPTPTDIEAARKEKANEQG